MPTWIIVALIGTVCAAAFLGAVFGVLIARSVIRRAEERVDGRQARAITPSEAAERVLAAARDLTISVSALDKDLRGRGAARG